MKIITEPKVYLVTRPSVDWRMVEAFLDDEELPGLPLSLVGMLPSHSHASAVVEIAARLCYMSFGKGRKDIADFINNLLSNRDGSVLEHVNYGFVITGISRSLSHELVRHRAGFAYSQRSQRYVDEAEAGFVVPPTILGLEESARATFGTDMSASVWAYEGLVEYLTKCLGDRAKGTDGRKLVRQAARSVLPNATETKMFVTANVRAWRHFIEQRASPFADLEIRRLAIVILEILQKEEPLLFGDFDVTTHTDGTKIATPQWSKV